MKRCKSWLLTYHFLIPLVLVHVCTNANTSIGSSLLHISLCILSRDGSDLSKTKDLKDKDGKLVLSGATDDDCRTIRRVCEAVSTRAARLAAAGVIALVRKVRVNFIPL